MNETQSFKFAPPFKQRSETVADKVLKWILYAILAAFLFWPALILIGIILAIGLAILAIIVALSIILIPIGIVARLFKLV